MNTKLDLALPISDWLKVEQPKNIWFTIVRDEHYERACEDTISMLTSLINFALDNYGDHETRQTRFIFGHTNYHMVGDFTFYHAIGNINGEAVPVIRASIDARIKI